MLRTPRVFWLPKAGNDDSECEDAVCVGGYGPGDGSSGDAVRIALTDGASESAFAREWAEALAGAFAASPRDLDAPADESLDPWLQTARALWHDRIPWDRLPWHGEAKARAGAFATLLGLSIEPSRNDSERHSFKALAVGDTCLFVVRGGRLRTSFPLEESAQFDSTPHLICSKAADCGEVWQGVRRCVGQCAAGDLLLLASDALAKWFLGRVEDGHEAWVDLLAMEPADWAAWVAVQRDAGLLDNDDTTLVIVEFD